MKQRIFKGLLAGLLSNSVGVCICLLILARIKKQEFTQAFHFFWNSDNFWMILALGALPNLLLFFGLLKKNKEYEARGVVMATFVTAITVFILYFKAI